MPVSGALCERVFETIESHYCVLWRSPPLSGKSTFRLLLEDWCLAHRRSYRVVSVSLLNFNAFAKAEAEADREWNDNWLSQAKLAGKAAPPWASLVAGTDTRPTLILLDDVQRFYHFPAAHPLWRAVAHVSANAIPGLRMLLLASYEVHAQPGASPPIPCALQLRTILPHTFRLRAEQHLTYADMQLTREERAFVFSAAATQYPLLQTLLQSKGPPRRVCV